MKRSVFAVIVFFVAALAMPIVADAQRRDFLTDDEIELVRDAQEIDRRIGVLVQAIDRRFEALNLASGAEAIKKKESWKWGPAPTGTRLDLLSDIKRILQKAIDDIDNLSEFPDSVVILDPEIKKKKTPADLFREAVRVLADAATRFEPVLDAELDRTKDEREKGLLYDSIDSCRQIKQAALKLPLAKEKD